MANAEPQYLQVDRRAALLIDCTKCLAEPGDPCWSDDGRREVDIHDERIAEVVEMTTGDDLNAHTFGRYDTQGKIKETSS